MTNLFPVKYNSESLEYVKSEADFDFSSWFDAEYFATRNVPFKELLLNDCIQNNWPIDIFIEACL